MKSLERGAGILLAISSLPSKYGIGTMGTEAYNFVDTLVDLRQKYWQVLPIGPSGFGDSPYQAFSAFAGNPYLIDLESLVRDKLLSLDEINAYDWGSEESEVDYALLFKSRFEVLYKAFSCFDQSSQEYVSFVKENEYWLSDYSLFMALKNCFDNNEWQSWDDDIRDHEPGSVSRYKEDLKDNIAFFNFIQYEFFLQWDKLKKYANDRGVKIIGEIPLYVSPDSADVWAHRDLFKINEDGFFDEVAGCPPDAYSKGGQKWGNPLYDWDEMAKDNYLWWYRRVLMNVRLYDVIRINHFVGIVKIYAVPETSQDGTVGKWYKGPGKALTDVIETAAKDTPVICEDFGTVVIPQVRKLMNKLGWPGMKVLLFAFNEDPSNPYLPHNFEDNNCVVYGTTHDSDTLVGHFKNIDDYKLAFLYEYLGVKKKEDIPNAFIRLAYSSIADVVILQMQDILMLGNEARMNHPSTIGTNWRWRLYHDAISEERRSFIRTLAGIYRR